MPQAYGEKIKKVPGVREVAIEDWFGGQYIDDRPAHQFARFAIDADKIFTVRPEMNIPDDQKTAFLRDRAGCLLGRPIASNAAPQTRRQDHPQRRHLSFQSGA